VIRGDTYSRGKRGIREARAERVVEERSIQPGQSRALPLVALGVATVKQREFEKG